MIDLGVPSFDLAEIQRGDRADQFRDCLLEHGVFYLSVGNLRDRHHVSARNLALDFFEHGSPALRAKLLNRCSTRRRGFTHLEAESTATVTGSGSYSDFSMAYSWGLTENVSPDLNFDKTWTAYFSRIATVAESVARPVLTAAAGRDVDLDVLRNCDPLLRLRYYPDVPESRCSEIEPHRMAAHYDLSIVTLVHQTACSNGFVSLQCEGSAGFFDIPVIPETVVVICGAVATLVSGGRVRAPRHRVEAPPLTRRAGSSRTSSVFFLRPRSSFGFSTGLARSLGFDVSIAKENATFGDWIGGNYRNLPVADLQHGSQMVPIEGTAL